MGNISLFGNVYQFPPGFAFVLRHVDASISKLLAEMHCVVPWTAKHASERADYVIINNDVANISYKIHTSQQGRVNLKTRVAFWSNVLAL